MESQNKGNMIARSALAGIGITVLFLLLGTVLDYIVTQVLSQFIIADCSEDCYFRYFNTFFIIVALISVAVGIRGSIRTYRRLSG
jgi:uncharacterized membrane protein